MYSYFGKLPYSCSVEPGEVYDYGVLGPFALGFFKLFRTHELGLWMEPQVVQVQDLQGVGLSLEGSGLRARFGTNRPCFLQLNQQREPC